MASYRSEGRSATKFDLSGLGEEAKEPDRVPYTQVGDKTAAMQALRSKTNLTHNPKKAYSEKGAAPPPGAFIQLTAPEIVHGKKKVDLSAVDPSPANVRRIKEVAQRQRTQNKVPDTTTFALPSFYDDPSESGDKGPGANSGVFLNGARRGLGKVGVSRGPGGEQKRKEGKGEAAKEAAESKSPGHLGDIPTRSLPPVVLDHPDYSSTMTLLRLTKPLVEEHAREVSAINNILHIPGSIELKRTIAKMYANPKNAEEISNAEWQRKEKKYEEERNKALQRQAEQLKKEREILKQEIENMKS